MNLQNVKISDKEIKCPRCGSKMVKIQFNEETKQKSWRCFTCESEGLLKNLKRESMEKEKQVEKERENSQASIEINNLIKQNKKQ